MKENITQKAQKTVNQCIQVHMKNEFRSKAIQTENSLVIQMISRFCQSVSTSPLKMKIAVLPKYQYPTYAINLSGKLFDIYGESLSDIFNTPSVTSN